VDSFAEAPPTAVPVQICVGPLGPIEPAEGADAKALGTGATSIARAQVQTIKALNALDALNELIRNPGKTCFRFLGLFPVAFVEQLIRVRKLDFMV
jgi:hypothetical protein